MNKHLQRYAAEVQGPSGAGAGPAVCGEIKPPDRDLAEMAASVDRNDRVGRYLAADR